MVVESHSGSKDGNLGELNKRRRQIKWVKETSSKFTTRNKPPVTFRNRINQFRLGQKKEPDKFWNQILDETKTNLYKNDGREKFGECVDHDGNSIMVWTVMM